MSHAVGWDEDVSRACFRLSRTCLKSLLGAAVAQNCSSERMHRAAMPASLELHWTLLCALQSRTALCGFVLGEGACAKRVWLSVFSALSHLGPGWGVQDKVSKAKTGWSYSSSPPREPRPNSFESAVTARLAGGAIYATAFQKHSCCHKNIQP